MRTPTLGDFFGAHEKSRTPVLVAGCNLFCDKGDSARIPTIGFPSSRLAPHD